MKGKIALFFIVALVVGGVVGFAGDGNGASGNRCNPAGTWYSELPSPPYMATITPIQGHSRYSVVFKGVYNASDLGFVSMTNWSGELVKSGDGYDVAIIAIAGGGEGMPHWDPLNTVGVKGHIEFSDECNTMDVTWPGGIYAWIWDITSETPPNPWVDEPDFQFGNDPILETYHRMIMPTD